MPRFRVPGSQSLNESETGETSRRSPSTRGDSTGSAFEQPLWSPPMTRSEGEQMEGRTNPEDQSRRLEWDDLVGLLSEKILPDNHSMTYEGADFLRFCLTHEDLVNLVHIKGFGGLQSSHDPPKRLLWEYCDKRNLSEVIRKRPNGVEEAFIWHVLLSLLSATRYLHQGVRDQTDYYDSDDSQQPIIHNAINPSNVFLRSVRFVKDRRPVQFGVGNGDIQTWPIVKLGNFSKARILQDQWFITSNADFPDLDTSNLTYFEAPEHTWGHGFRPDQGKGDVWSIAACAFAMMAGLDAKAKQEVPSTGTKYSIMKMFDLNTFVRSKNHDWKGWTATELNHDYSEFLRDFLETLLIVDPTQRPDASSAYDECVKQHKKFRQYLKQNVDKKQHDEIVLGKGKQKASKNDSPAAQRASKRRRTGGESAEDAVSISSDSPSSFTPSEDDNVDNDPPPAGPPPAGNATLAKIRADRSQFIGAPDGLKPASTQDEKDARADALFGAGQSKAQRLAKAKRDAEEKERRRLSLEHKKAFEDACVPDDVGVSKAPGGMPLEKIPSTKRTSPARISPARGPTRSRQAQVNAEQTARPPRLNPGGDVFSRTRLIRAHLEQRYPEIIPYPELFSFLELPDKFEYWKGPIERALIADAAQGAIDLVPILGPGGIKLMNGFKAIHGPPKHTARDAAAETRDRNARMLSSVQSARQYLMRREGEVCTFPDIWDYLSVPKGNQGYEKYVGEALKKDNNVEVISRARNGGVEGLRWVPTLTESQAAQRRGAKKGGREEVSGYNNF